MHEREKSANIDLKQEDFRIKRNNFSNVMANKFLNWG